MNSRWKDRLARDQMSLLASPACGPPLGPTATLELTPEPAQWGRRGPQSRHTVEEGRPPGDASRRVRDPSRQTSRPFPSLGPETLRSLPTSRTQPRRQPDAVLTPHGGESTSAFLRVPRARSFVTCSSSNPHGVPSRPRVHGHSTSLHITRLRPGPCPQLAYRRSLPPPFSVDPQ